MVELQSLMPLAVVGFAVAMAMFAEFIQYIVVYRTPAYQRMKANLDKHASKVETAKDATSSALNVKKREAKLQEWQQEAGKLNAGVQFKSAVVVSATASWRLPAAPPVTAPLPLTLGRTPLSPRLQTGCMLLLSFKLVPRVFGSVPVATLPFHPPGFIQSIAQRGLQDVTDPRACSPVRADSSRRRCCRATYSCAHGC